MKKALIETAALVVLAAMTAGFVMAATAADCWYAGEHTHGCNGTDNCNCTAEMVKLEAGK